MSETDYNKRIADLKKRIEEEQSILNDLAEAALNSGRPLASPEVLEQNSKVSQIISEYDRLRYSGDK